MKGDGRGSNLIFIGGCPRSGTTLAQLMLDSHPSVCGGPEFDRVPDIIELRDRLRSSVDSGRISVYCTREGVNREIGALIERLLAPYADERGCEMISEKTPFNALIFEELLEILPGARFVFCVRDPRAVVASMLEVGKRAKEKGQTSPGYTRNLYSAIRTIKATNDAGFRAAARSERVLTVVYERLVDQPERETTRICEFLGLPWAGEMLTPGEKRHDVENNLDGVWYTKDMFYSNPDPTRSRGWRKQLTAEQQAAISAAFGGDVNLEALGYDLSSDNFPATTRTASRAKLLAYSGLREAALRLVSYSLQRPLLGMPIRKLSTLTATARQQRREP